MDKTLFSHVLREKYAFISLYSMNLVLNFCPAGIISHLSHGIFNCVSAKGMK